MHTSLITLAVTAMLAIGPMFTESKTSSGIDLNFSTESAMGNYTIVHKPATLIIGIECRTSNASDAGTKDIPKLWERFYQENIISNIPHKISHEVIALYCDYEGDYTQPYSLVIGCPVSSIEYIPTGMVAKTIPASSYAVFRAVGEYPTSLIKTWERIWSESALQRTYTGDFELYGDEFVSGSPKALEVFIAIPKENTPR